MFWCRYSHSWKECCQFSSSCFGGSKIEVVSTENEMIRGCTATVASAFTLLPCHICWKRSYAYIHLFHSFTLDFSNNCPRSFFLLYHPRHYPFIGWNALAAIVVQRNAACPTFLAPFTQCDQKCFGFQSNNFISPSSVWVTCQFCRSRFSCCLPELCYSSLPSNLLPRFTA